MKEINKNNQTVATNSTTENLTEKKEDRTMAEVKNNQTQTVANNNNNEILEKKEGTGMKYNRLKATRVAEQEAKQAAIEAQAEADREAAIQAEIDATEPVDLVQGMDEIINNTIRTYRDENGNTQGTNGGQYYQKPVKGPDGNMTTITGRSWEEIAEIEEAIKNGLSGDGKYHKLVYIGGKACDCTGATLEELEADIIAAKKYYVAHNKAGGDVITDPDIEEQLVDAGYRKESLEQYNSEDYGGRYLIDYDGKYVMDTEGNTKADLTDLTSELNKEDTKKILIERTENVLREEAEAAAEAEDEEYEDEDEYYDEDECDEDEDY